MTQFPDMSALNPDRWAEVGALTDRLSWRVFRDKTDIGIAFSYEGARANVQWLRHLHYQETKREADIVIRSAKAKGALPFDQCVLGA